MRLGEFVTIVEDQGEKSGAPLYTMSIGEEIVEIALLMGSRCPSKKFTRDQIGTLDEHQLRQHVLKMAEGPRRYVHPVT